MQVNTRHIRIDIDDSARRIGVDVDMLAHYTASDSAICRYAYTSQYRATLAYVTNRLLELGFDVHEDAVGNLVARNRPPGEPVFGLGSHCDSNRNGGKYDGTLGVVTALEICRLNAHLGLRLPLEVICFLEEEGSGFGQLLLGSRIMAGTVSEQDLRQRFRSIDDDRPFWTHAEEAGYEPANWRQCGDALTNMTGWIELHIEQGRLLQNAGKRLGVVTAIAGYRHADVEVRGVADHAGGTPMEDRRDACVAAAACIVELERVARAASRVAPTVGTVGDVTLEPGIINVVPGRARFTMDIRGVSDAVVKGVFGDMVKYIDSTLRSRGLVGDVQERQSIPAALMDATIVRALEEAAVGSGESVMRLHSGAAHDTMQVATRVPTGMLFVPCRDGLSHVPEESADPRDAAVGAEVILNAIAALTGM